MIAPLPSTDRRVPPPAPAPDIAAGFAGIVGPDHVVTDPAERAYFSNDLFFWDGAGVAAAVVAPADAAQVAEVVRMAAARNLGVSVRGGGMSTGRSYVPEDDATVMLDMRRLDAIRDINTADRYVVVEAGCTWGTLARALARLGWRCDLKPPLSGNYSTVGGALAHGIPGGLDGVLGVEVVVADGAILRTGPWGRLRHAKPFYREYGPDLTGIFLGDTGAFGVKTAAALHISPLPQGRAFASFGFDTYEQAAEAMIALSTHDALSVRVCFDPYDTQALASGGLSEGIGVVSQTMEASGNLLRGLRDSLAIVKAGLLASKESCWSLNLVSEQFSQAVADVAIAAAAPACVAAGGRPITSPMAAAASSAVPFFTVRRFLGTNGERWIATNAMFPIGEAVDVVRKVERFFSERKAETDRHGIRVGILSQMTRVHFQCEPLFYWPDALDEIHFRHLPENEHARLRELKGDAQTREYVRRLRDELRDFFEEMGAIHVHTSKFFRYASLFGDAEQRLLAGVKAIVDPDRRLNRGNLGL